MKIVVNSCITGFEEVSKCNVGASFKFVGKLVKSPAKGQLFEMLLEQADKHTIQIYGQCDPHNYPLPKGK